MKCHFKKVSDEAVDETSLQKTRRDGADPT